VQILFEELRALRTGPEDDGREREEAPQVLH
jgi:hypothetical protein